jgi:hypothetical protein
VQKIWHRLYVAFQYPESSTSHAVYVTSRIPGGICRKFIQHYVRRPYSYALKAEETETKRFRFEYLLAIRSILTHVFCRLMWWYLEVVNDHFLLSPDITSCTSHWVVRCPKKRRLIGWFRMMNQRECGRKRLWLNLGKCSATCPDEWTPDTDRPQGRDFIVRLSEYEAADACACPQHHSEPYSSK